MADDKLRDDPLKSATCPNCGSRLVYSERNKANIICPACDSVFSAEDLVKEKVTNVAAKAISRQPSLLDQITSSDSALAYVENYFDLFDWDKFAETSDISIDEIGKMVETRKTVGGAEPSTWVMEFKYIAIPLLHKISGFDILVNKMVENYDNDDKYRYYDIYKDTVEVLIEKREELLKVLKLDIEYAKKYGAPKPVLDIMSEEYAKLEKGLGAIKEAKPIDEIPEFTKAVKKIEEGIVKEYSEAGIDAPTLYSEALQYINVGNYNQAAKNLAQILKYRNAKELVKKINKLFAHGNLYRFGDKHYYVTSKNLVAEYNTKKDAQAQKKGSLFGKKQEEVEAPEATTAHVVYEIVNLEPVNTPLIKDIIQIIAYFGTKLYYFKDKAGIVSFDFKTKEEKVVYDVKLKDVILGKGKTYTNDAGTKVFFKKKLEHKKDEKKGCSLFGKKAPAGNQVAEGNNYELYELDFVSDKVYKVCNEMVDVYLVSKDKIFYSVALKTLKETLSAKEVKKLEKREMKTGEDAHLHEQHSDFYVYDMELRKREKLLSEECEIHTVIDNKVIFSRWKYTEYNKDLYILDLETKQEKVLEENYYNYIDARNGKVFYTVGNDNHQPLFSIDFDGENRHEIMSEVEHIIDVDNNYVYFSRGRNGNTAIWKAPITSKGDRPVCICTAFKAFIKLTKTSLFYVSAFNELCVVRVDGEDLKTLAEDIVPAGIKVAKDGVYFGRHEVTNDSDENFSLYFIDNEGKNLRKIAFDAHDIITTRDGDEIYIERFEPTRFSFENHVTAKKVERHEELINLHRYYTYDVISKKLTLLLTTNYPKPGTNEVKSGCFGKKKFQGTITELPPAIFYKKKGVAKQGAELAKEKEAKAPAKQKGCLALFKALFKSQKK